MRQINPGKSILEITAHYAEDSVIVEIYRQAVLLQFVLGERNEV